MKFLSFAASRKKRKKKRKSPRVRVFVCLSVVTSFISRLPPESRGSVTRTVRLEAFESGVYAIKKLRFCAFFFFSGCVCRRNPNFLRRKEGILHFIPDKNDAKSVNVKMKINHKTWEINRFLQIAILQTIIFELAAGSVLPRPNIKQRSTTQIANVDKNYNGEETIVIVTSSELPKQIPPPPTPTKPHRPTPIYDVTSNGKELFHKSGFHDKESVVPFQVPYALSNANSFHNLT